MILIPDQLGMIQQMTSLRFMDKHMDRESIEGLYRSAYEGQCSSDYFYKLCSYSIAVYSANFHDEFH